MQYSRHFVICLALLMAQMAMASAKKPAGLTSEECLACHSEQVNQAAFQKSIHGSMFQCTDCHKDVKAAGPHDPAPAKVECATCHADEVQQYKTSVHGKAVAAGDSKAAGCLNCHGNIHEILPATDPASKVSHRNIPATCGSCHGQKFVMEGTGVSAQPFTSYQESVHGKAVAAGSEKAAVCTDCHGTHQILTAADSNSSIFRFNVPQTCAKCHENVKSEFMESIHGKAIAKGNSQAPVCTDCHGIHTIKNHLDPNSSVSAQRVAVTTCGRCHEGVRLTNEFGIAGSRTATYLESYHGLASKGGSAVAANCASCHGVHNILPSSDPKSTVNQANLAKTCGQCHPGAGPNFTKGKVHIASTQADVGSVAVTWVKRIYIGLIAATLGGMFLHNFLIWIYKAIQKRKAQRRLVTRMTGEQRFQHIILFTTFFTLVVTGFGLKYPDTWVAHIFGLPESIRGIVHRVAGTLMTLAGLYHIFYLIAKKDGRKMAMDMLPTPKDATDALGTMLYYTGLSNKKPEFKRFGYAEKMEYLALVWGTIVMCVTGGALWFKVFVGDLLPRWTLDVATAIHFYEAILATGAIFIWHFYWIIFDPDVYPMNWAWFDGKMDVELYHHEHAADHETIEEAVKAAAATAGTNSDTNHHR
jgi:cytochrome b subunit of formate dehydrogenase